MKDKTWNKYNTLLRRSYILRRFVNVEYYTSLLNIILLGFNIKSAHFLTKNIMRVMNKQKKHKKFIYLVHFIFWYILLDVNIQQILNDQRIESTAILLKGKINNAIRTRKILLLQYKKPANAIINIKMDYARTHASEKTGCFGLHIWII